MIGRKFVVRDDNGTNLVLSMKGTLKKQGQVVGSDLGGLWTPFRWRERYFEERDDKLFYFKRAGDSESKGFIDLKDVVKVQVRLTVLVSAHCLLSLSKITRNCISTCRYLI